MSTQDFNLFDNVDLMDARLDDLSDRPEFQPFPSGLHKVTFNWTGKPHKDHPNKIGSYSLKLTHLDTIELADPTKEGPQATKDGKRPTMNVSFFVLKQDGEKNPWGEGDFKNLLKKIREVSGGASIGEILKASEGGEFIITLKNTQGKPSKDEYGTVVAGKINTEITEVTTEEKLKELMLAAQAAG